MILFPIQNRDVSFFETTIRELGGLLSAYELSKDRMFLRKAEDLGTRLLKGFGSGTIPFASVNLKTGAARSPSWTGGASILSEIGTLQLEFLYLAYHTKNPSYAEKVFFSSPFNYSSRLSFSTSLLIFLFRSLFHFSFSIFNFFPGLI